MGWIRVVAVIVANDREALSGYGIAQPGGR